MKEEFKLVLENQLALLKISWYTANSKQQKVLAKQINETDVMLKKMNAPRRVTMKS